MSKMYFLYIRPISAERNVIILRYIMLYLLWINPFKTLSWIYIIYCWTVLIKKIQFSHAKISPTPCSTGWVKSPSCHELIKYRRNSASPRIYGIGMMAWSREMQSSIHLQRPVTFTRRKQREKQTIIAQHRRTADPANWIHEREREREEEIERVCVWERKKRREKKTERDADQNSSAEAGRRSKYN